MEHKRIEKNTTQINNEVLLDTHALAYKHVIFYRRNSQL